MGKTLISVQLIERVMGDDRACILCSNEDRSDLTMESKRSGDLI